MEILTITLEMVEMMTVRGKTAETEEAAATEKVVTTKVLMMTIGMEMIIVVRKKNGFFLTKKKNKMLRKNMLFRMALQRLDILRLKAVAVLRVL